MTTTFLTETRERFLKAILAKLPIGQIREVYLFQAIKQGGVESGVAVVAALPLADGSRPLAEDNLLADGSRQSAEEPPADEQSSADRLPPTADEQLPADQQSSADRLPPTADEQLSADQESSADGLPPTDDRAGASASARYTVYTAHYRHTLKGPDRGKWEAHVVAEADAPLVSIESVVRGVQRRAGDVDAADHMTGDEIRAALRLTPPTSDAA